MRSIHDCILQRSWAIDSPRDELHQPSWNLFWSDKSVSTERVLKMKAYQRINHFPGMQALSKKVQLGIYLKRMQSSFPQDYTFFPQTWSLPHDWSNFTRTVQSQASKNRTYIVKPNSSSQGKGIFLTRKSSSIDRTVSQVIQRYVSKPLLMEGYKFDLRLYVLVRSINPLCIFLYDDGLVRLCTTKYVSPTGSNLRETTMHLTNYAVNKDCPEFIPNTRVEDDGTGSKRSIKWFRTWLKEHPSCDAKSTWRSIEDVIVKTILAAQPVIAETNAVCGSPYESKCFEVLGFDIMLDSKFRPWLIEVNHSPSFTASSPMDESIKRNLIVSTLDTLNLKKNDKEKFQKQSQKDSRRRLYQNTTTASKNQEKSATKTKLKYNNFTQIFPPPLNSPFPSKFDKLVKGARDLHVTSKGMVPDWQSPKKMNLQKKCIFDSKPAAAF